MCTQSCGDYGNQECLGRVVLTCVVVLVMSAALAYSREPISFSVNDADPQVVQQRDRPRFSIHDRDEISRGRPAVAFSIIDAKPLDIPAGTPAPNVPPPPDEDAPPKPDCAPARLVNRVLVILHDKPVSETVRVKVCDAFGCRFENRVTQHSPKESQRVLAELKKLEPKWTAGHKDCDHFLLIDADDPQHAKLIKELDVKRGDLPLLIKETDPNKRKRAAGLSGAEITKLWNKWFLEPTAEPAAEAPACVPGVGSFAGYPQWDYRGSGSLRDHLTDPRGLHHLPRAVVDPWSDRQIQAWHNWHHEVLAGRRVATPQPVATPRQSVGRQSGQSHTNAPRSGERGYQSRATQLAQAALRPMPVLGQPGDSAKKKRLLFGSGNMTNANAFAARSLGSCLPSIVSGTDSSIRSRC